MGNIKTRLITLLQLILVIIFIIFEELIWEGIAKPIYEWVHSLKVLVKLERILNSIPSWVILVLFVVLLIAVESLGLIAGALFLSGHMLIGLGLYSIKIPIAAFTFWMFKVTDSKLMKYEWFAWLYGKIMKFIDWMKSLEIYHSTIEKIKLLKSKLKELRLKYFTTSSPFIIRTKQIYKSIKTTLKKFKNG
jgi:hypothetical protein